MVDITIDNYEAFFLDFAEGNLSEAERLAVLQFVEFHPELKEELEGFEIISIADSDIQTSDWSSLKKTESDAKEELYFKAVENDLTETEKGALDTLLKSEENQGDFKVWQQTVVKSQGEEISKSELYQLGFELPIGQHNYEHFLIAFGEGLLDASQVELLKAYAGTQTVGERDLGYASALRLKPAKGIFYPDKKALYKKEKRIAVWWYRAAAIAVLLTFGAFLFNTMNQNSSDVQIAEQPKLVEPSEGTSDNQEEVSKEETTQESDSITPVEIIIPKTVQEADFHENIAEHSAQPEEKTVPTKEDNQRQNQVPVTIENPEPMEIMAVQPVDTVPVDMEQNLMEPLTIETDDVAQADPENTEYQSTFKTIPQMAEDAIASRFEIKDEEREEMAMVIAKRVTDKAGKVLNSELSKEISDNGDNTTYTFRFRNFKVQHSRNR